WSGPTDKGAGGVRAPGASRAAASRDFRSPNPTEPHSPGAAAEFHSKETEESTRLADLIASVPGIVWEWYAPSADSQAQGNYVSPYVQTMLGLSQAQCEAADDLWPTLAHPEDR